MNRNTRSTFLRLIGIAAVFTPAVCLGQSYTINTMAGGANPYFYLGTGDGGPAIGAGLAHPCNDVAVDGAGNLYIAAGSLIRKVATDGTITTFAGGGLSIGDGVPATQAELSPIAIAADGAGDLYIADTAFGSSLIRKVDTNGIITTVAGGAQCCALGDNGPATAAYLAIPYGLAVDTSGNLYIAQVNSNNNLVRKVSANGIITTLAGGGPCCALGDGGPATAISLGQPTGVAVDGAGNVYIAEASGNRIREVSKSGTITTIAGTGAGNNSADGGPAIQAGVDRPYHVAVDAAGNIYITQINDARVRMITPARTIATIAGNGTHGFSGDGGPAKSATMDRPSGIAPGRHGLVYVADATTAIPRVRLLTPRSLPVCSFNDFAGNGLSGALLYDPTLGQSYTALSDANGTYSYVPNLFTPGFDTLRTGDFNGDGKADLILYNSHTSAAYIGFGNGQGTFNFQSLFWSPGYDTVVTGDINGDGKTDVALYNSTTGTLYTGISNGDGTFTYEYHLVSQTFTYVKLADFSGDGNADLFLYRSSDGLAYLGIGDGKGGFTFNPLSISAGYNLADSGDLNGDGKADIILYNVTNGNAATGISNGTGGFTFTPLVFSPGFTSVRLGGYTGRVTADVTVYNKNTAVAYFGTGTGTGTFDFQSLFWSPGYDKVIPEEVDADGKTDIVLYNTATGTEYTGISNGNGTFDYTYSYWGIGKILAQ